MSLIRKLAGETVLYGLSSILSRVLNFVVLTPLYTYLFADPSEYGVLSDMYVYAALLIVILTYRMETTFFRFGRKAEDLERTYSTTVWSILGTTIIGVCILIFFAPELATWLKYPEYPQYVQWFALIIGFDALAALPFARLRLLNRPLRFAILKALAILINIGLVVLFLIILPRYGADLLADFQQMIGIETRVGLIFFANLLTSAFTLLLLLPELRTIKWTYDRALIQRMIIYAAPLFVVSLSAVINQLINIPLLKNLLPFDLETNLAEAGIFAACGKIAIFMSLFNQAFNYAAEPFFFKNADRTDAKEIYARVGQVFTAVGAFIFLGIYLFLDVLKYFIGSAYWEGLSVVPFLLMSYLMLGLYYNFAIWYKLTDKTSYGAWISLAGAAITLGLNFALIPSLSYYGSAIASLSCYAFMAWACYYFGRKHYTIPYPIRQMGLYIGGAIIVAVVYSQIPQDFSVILLYLIRIILLLSFLGFIWKVDKKPFLELMGR